MNVYDCANELAKALKESHELKNYRKQELFLKKMLRLKNLPMILLN